MSLLALERVEKAYGAGAGKRSVLRGVTLEVQAGEVVAVWGKRRSGRSTLLRVAAGIEPPDAGSVRFEGRDLRDGGRDALGAGIGYCRRTFRPSEGRIVLDHITTGLLARGVPPAEALERALEALARTAAEEYGECRAAELNATECVRVAIARAAALQPRVLLVDEPTIGIDQPDRDEILALLQSFAAEGIAIVMSTGEAPALSGARALTLSDGELHRGSTRELAPVVPLRRSA